MTTRKAHHQKTNIRVPFVSPINRACSLLYYAKENLKDHSQQHDLNYAYELITRLEKALAGVPVSTSDKDCRGE